MPYYVVLKNSNINFQRDHKLVRGLDYYNGTCFEIKLEGDSEIMGVLGES